MKKYIDCALKSGAKNCVEFSIEDICFDPRTIIKCMYGCGDWGKGPTCPSRPNNVDIFSSIEIFRRYKRGVIIHSNDKKISQNVSYAIESLAFCDGYYFAISLSDCALCKECMGLKGHPCANPKKARAAFHSVGIDVFATVKKLSLPLYTLKNLDDEQNWYSAVFIE